MALSCLVISTSGQRSSDPEKSELTILRSQRMLEISNPLSGKPDSLWYVGMQYNPNYIKSVGTPYFFDKSNIQGRICFNGSEYDKHMYMYDLEKDEIMVKAYIESEGVDWIVLNRGWVDWITLELDDYEYRFVTERNPVLNAHMLEEGYYELIHEGPGLILLGKHSKDTEFRPEISEYNIYTYMRDLILIREKETYDVSKFRELVRLFPQHKRALRSMNRENKEKYDEASSKQLKKMMAYCESIITKGATHSDE